MRRMLALQLWQSAPALAQLLDEVERLAGGHPETLEVRALRVELARLGLFLWNPDFYETQHQNHTADLKKPKHD